MNTEYLSVIFKDPRFLVAYEEMLRDFDSEFDAFNLLRFNRFYEYLVHCYVNNNLTAFRTSKECKSKLPYPNQWKQFIHQTALNLYEVHYLRSGQGEGASSEEDNRESS